MNALDIGTAVYAGPGACSTQDILDKVASPQDRQLAERLIADVQNNRSADFASLIAPELRPVLAPQWPAIRAMTPQGRARLVDARFNDFKPFDGGQSVHNAFLAYELDEGTHHALVRITLQRTNQAVVTSFYVNPMAKTVEDATQFGLSGKSPLHYAMLLLSIAAFVVIVAALVLIVRTRGIRRKWLWFLGSLFGICQIGSDWSTGALFFNPLYLQLLGGFAVRPGGIADWQVGFGLPVVAILFLIRRPYLMRAREKDQRAVFS